MVMVMAWDRSHCSREISHMRSTLTMNSKGWGTNLRRMWLQGLPPARWGLLALWRAVQYVQA